MSLNVKLVASLIIAGVAATLVAVAQTGSPFQPMLLIGFAVVGIACTLLGNYSPRQRHDHDATDELHEASESEVAPPSGDRESGKVKWFNVSKGFGFIIKDDGEEIFVHFRAIRGKGRRGLKDGQRVSFVVVDSEKGPQAEDVVPDSAD